MICVNNLTKKYGSNTAVSELSFEIEDGKIYGFLGPNGAGKSTTMNIITGCLAPTAGSVSIDGIDTFEDPKGAKRLIGYLPEQPPVYGEMTPAEYLTFVGKAKGLRGAALEKDIEYVMEKTGITHVAGRLIRNLSKGYKQRVGIAQAMLGNPKFIILDEPTVGLDPRQIIEIRSLIRELSDGHTVILSSHILAEVQEVCDELIIIAGGRIAAAGTMDEITDRLGGENTIDLITKGAALDSAAFEGISGVSTVSAVEDGDTVHFTLTFEKGSDVREDVFRAVIAAGGVLLEMHTEVPTLEDIFLRITEMADEEEEEEPAEELAPSVAEAAELLADLADEDGDDDDEEDDEDNEDDNEDDGDDGDDSYKPLFS